MPLKKDPHSTKTPSFYPISASLGLGCIKYTQEEISLVKIACNEKSVYLVCFIMHQSLSEMSDNIHTD